MAINVSLNNVASLQDTSTAANTININSNTIAAALSDAVSRSGQTPNAMSSALDMNGNRILNLPVPISPTDVVRLEDLSGGVASSALNINLPANNLYGNPTGGSAAGTGVPISGLLSFSGGTLTTQNLVGDVTSAGTSTTIGTGVVANSKLATVPANSVIGNNAGTTQPATYLTASQVLDTVGLTKGDVLYRDTAGWNVLPPGTNGFVLTTNGAGTNPTWTVAPGAGVGSGSVTSVAMTVPAYETVTGSPVTTSGTLAITANNQAANTILAGPTTGAATTPAYRALVGADLPVGGVANANLATMSPFTAKANLTGGTAIPTDVFIPNLMDSVSVTRGSVLYRGASAWSAIAPGTAGFHLTTNGAGADPTWTSNAVNTGFTTVASTGNVTNDTNSINNALSTLHSSGGGTVWLVSPTYTLGNISVPSGCSLRGMGPMATVITSAAAGSLINLAAPSSGICIRDLGITGNCTNAISDNNVSNMGFALIDNVNIEGTGFTISNGIVFSGSGLGGYWNRINNCRINNVGNAIVLNGSNALNAVLRDIDIGGGNIGVNAVGDAAAGTFFVMENVQCNSCTNIGFAATNCSFSANNCIMDGCGNYATNLFYNSISGMPSIGYYVNMTHTWSNFSQNTNPGVGNFIGSGMVVDTTALSTIKLTINLASCRCEENKFTGLVLNGNTSSPTNLRASVTGCVFIQNNIGNTTTPINGEGAYFSACKVSAVGNHMTDNLTGAAGMFLTANSSGAVIGNIGVNNPGGTVINNGTAVTTGNS